MLCLRAMTGSLVLFDHLHLTGAFNRKSPINAMGCIELLKNYTGKASREGLLDTIRLTTIHLLDPDTPPEIRRLLDKEKTDKSN